ncbi:DUF4861 family protein [Chondrinema litorale]|uniref:DUF4861 family protein n=1 Tax=Chondrinema litorale TaxID=2994555 RepID=UPI002542C9D9|nr:DUF4861 family protein [Chondrinema litorale]UZR96904.1 DUF4861 family protein [Chondrinema litorale]
MKIIKTANLLSTNRIVKKSLQSIFIACLFGYFLSSCTEEKSTGKTVTVKNPLSIDRQSETIELDLTKLKDLTEKTSIENILVKDANGNVLVRQLIDYDQDGTPDELLFQTDIKANGELSFSLTSEENGASQQVESKLTTFSRFVPERTDDYTWENDKVAFRTYGPTGQKEALEGVPGSTLSSGMDLWLKRADKSIIDKWYAEHLKSPGYYHIDHGEGYDPYHVGGSRGTGGIGIWDGDSLLVSQNFTEYKTIAAGPIRTVFDLTYAPWSEYGLEETKRISLDLGSNFSKYELSLNAAQSIPNITVGLTMHNGEGEAKLQPEAGWVRYWEKIDDAWVGEGIIFNQTTLDSAFNNTSDVPDQKQILVVNKPTDKLTYLAGFGWTKSGQILSVEDWDALLAKEAEKFANPLEISIK